MTLPLSPPGSAAPRALALVGMPGAGKSLCAAHLHTRGYFSFRFGSIVVEEVARRGLVLNAANERLVREEFRAHDGMAAIARRALPILRDALANHRTIIMDGLYSQSEYRLLLAELGAPMRVLAVVCDRDRRYARLAERPERPLTRDEAEARDFAEIENLEKGGPIAMADYFLLNNGTAGELTAALDEVLARLGVQP